MTRVFALVIALGLAGISAAQAGEKTGTSKEGHLGLGVEAVPPALYSQLTGVLAKGQGVMVEQVAKDSPAAKAGLQPHDILLTVDEQKINSPAQLVKMIRHDKPGQQVSLGYLRGGKVMSCKVTLDAAEHHMQPHQPRVFHFFPDERFQRMFEDFEAKSNDSAWNMFDSIKLTRTDAKHWRAEVDYRNKDGKKDTKVYNGTREEIRKAIESENDLPAQERENLLRALNLRSSFEFHFPPFESTGGTSLNRP
ncbi:MAG TPA: PDZ domain-containing protein [Gemmataceae bacterium]|nr:PDZ domain-containing protein [Gemmataceae bacterium]